MASVKLRRLSLLLEEIDRQRLRSVANPFTLQDEREPRPSENEGFEQTERGRIHRDNLDNLFLHIKNCIETGQDHAPYFKSPDESLIWKVPAFCGTALVIDQVFVKDRIVALQQHRGPALRYTEDIWGRSAIQKWEESTKSSLILLQGNSESQERLEIFGVEIVEHLGKSQHVVHLLSPLPSTKYTSMSTPISSNQVLRQLVVQCLKKLSHSAIPDVLGFMASVTDCFKRDRLEDWFTALEDSLQLLRSPVSIIVNIEVLRGKVEDLPSWLTHFQALCQRLDSIARLNVMIIVCRKVSHAKLGVAIPVVLVDKTPAPLPYHEKKIIASRPDRTPPSVLKRHQLTSKTTGGELRSNSDGYCGDVDTNDPAPESSTGFHIEDTVVSNQKTSPSLLAYHGSNSTGGKTDRYGLGKFQAAKPDEMDRSARSWFKILASKTHQSLYNSKRFPTEYDSPIKVAVLDTGFAYTEPMDKRTLKPYKHRIRRFTNFVDDGEGDLAALRDPSGHGTAVAVQVLKVSLTAVLYICRVAKGDDERPGYPDKSAVERAIRKAAAKPDNTGHDGGGWGVDIITMSFGWNYDDNEGVREAIRFARHEGVHMFASASNYGLLGPSRDVMYPARATEVFAIDGADGLGEYVGTNASSLSVYGGERFSAPSLGLSSPNSDKAFSGSSFACPIAAGIGAMILEFVRQSPLRDSPTVQHAIIDMRAMAAILRLTSKQKGPDGFKFLMPWMVFHDEEQRRDTSYLIVKELRKEFGSQLGAEVHPLPMKSGNDQCDNERVA